MKRVPMGEELARMNAERILLIRPSALGDVVRTVGVVNALRKRFPKARIDWMVQDSFAGSVRGHRALRGETHGSGEVVGGSGEVVEFARKQLARWWLVGSKGFRAMLGLRTRLKQGRYDVVIDAQGLLRSALFAKLTGAKVIVGDAQSREGARFFYTHVVDTSTCVHTVDRMMLLAGAVGCDVGWVDLSLDADAKAMAWVEGQAWGKGEFVVLAPTSRWKSKQWSDQRYVQLCTKLRTSRPEVCVVVVGGRGEERQIPGLMAWCAGGKSGVVNLVGKTSIEQLVAVISKARVVVGSDSAAVHVAVGFDRRLVALYGPTDVSRVGPYGKEGDVIQHVGPGEPLGHKSDEPGRSYMERISVDEVFAAVMARI